MNKRIFGFAIMLVASISLVACSSSNRSATVDATPEIGLANPPLPPEVNAIAFTVGAVAGLGNAEVRMLLPADPPEVPEGVFLLEVVVSSGALEPFTIRPDMFRVYTLDGASYTPVAVAGIEQFGNTTLDVGESYQGLMAVEFSNDSPPALFLADLSDLGERFFAGAFSVDPDYIPETQE